MPTPKSPITVGARSSSLGAGDYVIFRNITQGNKRSVKCDADGNAIVNDPPDNWLNGDTIIAEVQGRMIKGVSTKIAKGGAIVNFGTITADTSSPAINL